MADFFLNRNENNLNELPKYDKKLPSLKGVKYIPKGLDLNNDLGDGADLEWLFGDTTNDSDDAIYG